MAFLSSQELRHVSYNHFRPSQILKYSHYEVSRALQKYRPDRWLSVMVFLLLQHFVIIHNVSSPTGQNIVAPCARSASVRAPNASTQTAGVTRKETWSEVNQALDVQTFCWRSKFCSSLSASNCHGPTKQCAYWMNNLKTWFKMSGDYDMEWFKLHCALINYAGAELGAAALELSTKFLGSFHNIRRWCLLAPTPCEHNRTRLYRNLGNFTQEKALLRILRKLPQNFANSSL